MVQGIVINLCFLTQITYFFTLPKMFDQAVQQSHKYMKNYKKHLEYFYLFYTSLS